MSGAPEAGGGGQCPPTQKYRGGANIAFAAPHKIAYGTAWALLAGLHVQNKNIFCHESH